MGDRRCVTQSLRTEDIIVKSAAPAPPAGQWTTDRLKQVFDLQRQGQIAAGPPGLELRKDRLDRLGAALSEHADDLVRAISADYGNRPLAGALASEVLLQLEEIRITRGALASWMQPRKPQPKYMRALGIQAWVEPTPLGVVGVISPWNFPVGLAVQPAIAAIAAGNRVMIKMSELTPAAGEALAAALADRFDADELAVVTGGLDIAVPFSSLPFDHIFFTGSSAVGKLVQRSAAENLTPVTLELGGKNPTVLAQDADFAKAVGRIVRGRLANSGQICLSPDYVFVPRPRVSEFVTAAEEACRKTLPTVLTNVNYCSIINDRHYERIQNLIADARQRGATVREVIPPGEQLPSPQTRRMPFTLITDVTPDMAVMQEEIFGPVMPVLPYDTVDEVIEYVNAQPIPLGSYWFGPDSPEFRKYAARTRSGGVTRNDFAVHVGIEGLPFGGVGNSGTGYYHGQYGFETFSHMRAFAVSPDAFSPASLLTPPFSPRFEKGLRTVIRLWGKSFARRAARGKPSERG
jgi:coniferyl-aldehyde dehydrogenase